MNMKGNSRIGVLYFDSLACLLTDVSPRQWFCREGVESIDFSGFLPRISGMRRTAVMKSIELVQNCIHIS